MSQEEINELSDRELNKLSLMSAESCSHTGKDKLSLRMVMGWAWQPQIDTSQAMHLACLLDMNISFGDRVVLVSEPAGVLSRTIEYSETGRVAAMRRAITLLSADYAKYL